MAHDLFGRPVYHAPPARQPDLFGARHWFELGYLDAVGDHAEEPGGNDPYRLGYAAGRRDVEGRAVSVGLEESMARAWRSAVAVGNVQE